MGARPHHLKSLLLPSTESAEEPSMDHLFCARPYGQAGDFARVEHLLYAPAFLIYMPRAKKITFFQEHVAFKFADKGYLMVRLVEHESFVHDLRVTKAAYAELQKLRDTGGQKWQDFLAEEKKRRTTSVDDVSENAVVFCQRLIAKSSASIDEVAFAGMSFTRPAHAALFARVLGGANLRLKRLSLPVHIEEDQWLANFLEPDRDYRLQMELLRPLMEGCRRIDGICRYAMSILWEPVELEECGVDFSAFWFQHYPYKIKMRTERLIAQQADSYYINDTLLKVMEPRELVFEFIGRAFEPLCDERPIDNVMLEKLILVEPDVSFGVLADYDHYAMYIFQQLQTLKTLELRLGVSLGSEGLAESSRAAIQLLLNAMDHVDELIDCRIFLQLNVQGEVIASELPVLLGTAFQRQSDNGRDFFGADLVVSRVKHLSVRIADVSSTA